jgi:N-acyl-D-amino-acid deacylase
LLSNLATLVGHGTVRAGVVAAPDRSELHAMRDTTARSLDEGAVGLSSGLIYTPGSFASSEELAELARAAGERGRPYVTRTTRRPVDGTGGTPSRLRG